MLGAMLYSAAIFSKLADVYGEISIIDTKGIFFSANLLFQLLSFWRDVLNKVQNDIILKI